MWEGSEQYIVSRMKPNHIEIKTYDTFVMDVQNYIFVQQCGFVEGELSQPNNSEQ